ncbi:MAG: hypothetical protein ACKVH0_01475 [Alphaproteobacteria bacterium]
MSIMDGPKTKPDAPIAYMERTRKFYRALGYERDYRWAQNDDTAFTPMRKPLADSRIAIVTTSFPPGDYSDDHPPAKAVWSGSVADAPADLYNQNLAWDKESTHTRDRESYLPLNAMQDLAERGVIGEVGRRFHGVPTIYSHRETLTKDAPNILARIQEDHADAVLLVPL